MDLFLELQQKIEDLYRAIREFKAYGIDLAEKERDYKVTLAQTCLTLKAQGLAVGLIDKTCHGEGDVPDARFDRDTAEVEYKAAQEMINAIKLQIKVIEGQIAREYGR